MNPREMGLEAYLERELPFPDAKFSEEFKTGLEYAPELAKILLPRIYEYERYCDFSDPTVWLEWVAMVGLFAPYNARKLFTPARIERMHKVHPGFLLLLRATLDRLVEKRYGDTEPGGDHG